LRIPARPGKEIRGEVPKPKKEEIQKRGGKKARQFLLSERAQGGKGKKGVGRLRGPIKDPLTRVQKALISYRLKKASCYREKFAAQRGKKA